MTCENCLYNNKERGFCKAHECITRQAQDVGDETAPYQYIWLTACADYSLSC